MPTLFVARHERKQTITLGNAMVVKKENKCMNKERPWVRLGCQLFRSTSQTWTFAGLIIDLDLEFVDHFTKYAEAIPIPNTCCSLCQGVRDAHNYKARHQGNFGNRPRGILQLSFL